MSAANTRMNINSRSECANNATSLKMSALGTLVTLIVAMVLIVASVAYSYLKKTDHSDGDTNNTNEVQKRKVIGNLSLGASIVALIAVVLSIWNNGNVNKATRSCMVLN